MYDIWPNDPSAFHRICCRVCSAQKKSLEKLLLNQNAMEATNSSWICTCVARLKTVAMMPYGYYVREDDAV